MSKSGKPMSPDDVLNLRRESIPGYVYDAFNACIVRCFNGQHARVLQKDVVDEILRLGPEGLLRGDIFDRGYLEIEKSYESEGWSVVYDKPGETSGASFTSFTFKKR